MTSLSNNSVKMALLINGGNSHINKVCARFPKRLICDKQLETVLKHSTLFNDVQSVIQKEIAVKHNK